MIAAAIGAGSFHGPQTAHLFDDHQDGPIAAVIGTDGARVGGIEGAAGGTGFDLVGGDGQGLGQGPQQLVLALQKIKSGTSARTGTKPRQFAQKLDQTFNLGSGGSGHLWSGKPRKARHIGERACGLAHQLGLQAIQARLGVTVGGEDQILKGFGVCVL